jgi:two-component system, NarL family, response regulator NreC
METTLLIADDHRLLREGLRRIVEARNDLRVVAEAGNGEEAVRAALERKPHVALVDLTMPRLSGVEAIRRIRRAAPIPCIAVSMHEQVGHVTQALEAGASGYVVKSAAASELLDAIDAVRAGRTYLSPSIAHWAVDAIARPGARPVSSLRALTAREREVLQLVAEGLTSKEIAAALGVSLKTIETHRTNLMAKLEIRKASSLVRIALQEGLIAT